jgi:hypothetical protein
MRAAQERASCGIGIDNEETRSASAYRMNPDYGPIWYRLEGNARTPTMSLSAERALRAGCVGRLVQGFLLAAKVIPDSGEDL